MSHGALILYAAKDKVVADAICNKLENRKVRCWIAPRDFSMDGAYGKSLSDILSKCRLTILILSPDNDLEISVKQAIEKASSMAIPILTYWIVSDLSKHLQEKNAYESHWLSVINHDREESIDRFLEVAMNMLAVITPGDNAVSTENNTTTLTLESEKQVVTGQTVFTDAGTAYVIEELIGKGAQGKIYRVNASGNIKAIKWYEQSLADDDRKNSIMSLIQLGAPDGCFTWPEEVVERHGTPGFGYTMKLIEPEFIRLTDLAKHKVKPDIHTLIAIGLNVTRSLWRLHSKGLCYADISPGNIFIDPHTGDVRICDNDNIAGDSNIKKVLGTPKFMAPEIVCGKNGPNISTDNYSLAVLLFTLFFDGHPLEGRNTWRADLHDKTVYHRLFGSEPLFVFDPKDSSNRPIPGKHDNMIIRWGVYPKFFRDLFTRAFNDNIRDPTIGRVSEKEWMLSLIKLHESIFHCPDCGFENFYDQYTLKANGGKPGLCRSCMKALTLPPRIKIADRIAILEEGIILYEHGDLLDFSRPLARVLHRRSGDGQLDILNLSTDAWTITLPDGVRQETEPGARQTLLNGMKIMFGKLEGEIRA